MSQKGGWAVTIDYDAIGLRIKMARIKAKMTQQTLADRVCLSPAHISNIETGNTKLSLPTIIHIANALSVSVDELLSDNVVHTEYVFNREAQELLSDCSSYELRVLVDVLKGTKEALRKDQCFQDNATDKKRAAI